VTTKLICYGAVGYFFLYPLVRWSV